MEVKFDLALNRFLFVMSETVVYFHDWWRNTLRASLALIIFGCLCYSLFATRTQRCLFLFDVAICATSPAVSKERKKRMFQLLR